MSSQLKLTDITKKFEANTVNEKVALDHLNLTVEPGQFVTVLGSNSSINLPCLTSSSEAFFQMKEKCT